VDAQRLVQLAARLQDVGDVASPHRVLTFVVALHLEFAKLPECRLGAFEISRLHLPSSTRKQEAAELG
jgi:hypothetical protein